MKCGGFNEFPCWLVIAFWWMVIVLSTVMLISYGTSRNTDRARECSTMLLKYADGRLTPLTDDATMEIGACLLEFNQPLNGE